MDNPAPTTLEEVLSPSWLTDALSPRYPGLQVTNSTVTWRQDNVASKVRFTIDVEPMTSPPPSSWCVKGYWGRPDRYSAGDREAEFYGPSPRMFRSGCRPATTPDRTPQPVTQ
jgi:hypothetical protein